MIYSTVNHQRGGWVGLRKSKTWWRNTCCFCSLKVSGMYEQIMPLLLWFIFQKRFFKSLFWNESYFSTQHGKRGLRKYVSQWKVTNESVKWNFFANNNTPVPLYSGWHRKIGVIQMWVILLHFVQTNISVYSSNLAIPLQGFLCMICFLISNILLCRPELTITSSRNSRLM